VGGALKVGGSLSADELKRLAASETHLKVRERILIVRYVLMGNTIPQTATVFPLSERQIRVWIGRYNTEGLAGLKDRPKPGQPVRLKPEFMESFKARLDAGPRIEDGVCVFRGKDLQRILRSEFQAEYSLDGVYALLHRMSYSSLVPRPRHPKADPGAQAAFKKTSVPSWRATKPPMPARTLKSGSRTKRASVSKAR
jgi:transposase